MPSGTVTSVAFVDPVSDVLAVTLPVSVRVESIGAVPANGGVAVFSAGTGVAVSAALTGGTGVGEFSTDTGVGETDPASGCVGVEVRLPVGPGTAAVAGSEVTVVVGSSINVGRGPDSSGVAVHAASRRRIPISFAKRISTNTSPKRLACGVSTGQLRNALGLLWLDSVDREFLTRYRVFQIDFMRSRAQSV